MPLYVGVYVYVPCNTVCVIVNRSGCVPVQLINPLIFLVCLTHCLILTDAKEDQLVDSSFTSSSVNGTSDINFKSTSIIADDSVQNKNKKTHMVCVCVGGGGGGNLRCHLLKKKSIILSFCIG